MAKKCLVIDSPFKLHERYQILDWEAEFAQTRRTISQNLKALRQAKSLARETFFGGRGRQNCGQQNGT